jgi:MFS family permease
MPPVRRRVKVTLDAGHDEVRDAATRVLGLVPDDDGSLTGALYEADSSTALRMRSSAIDPTTTLVTLEALSLLQIPYFGWFVRLLTWFGSRRALRHVAARLRAELAGEPSPPAPRRPAIVAPVSFTADQARQLAAVAAVAILANFGGSLLTQNGDAVTQAFGESDQALGFALALARVGVLLSLLASALSDRFGRRRLLLGCLVAVCAANALSAAAPSFEVFTAGQVLSRSFVNGALVVAAIVVVEEAPEGARAFAFSMFALALGAGFGVSVLLLPLADIGDEAWRIAFAISALSVLCVPSISRHLHETGRYQRLVRSHDWRGRLRELFDHAYRSRFILLGLTAFLANVFSAPSSQLTNRYLTKTHDFSHSEVAAFRGVTAGFPGFIGIILAGRLAETRGRRPVTIAGLVVGSLFQAAFFLGDGALLWLMPTIAIVAAACAGLAVGTLDGELFPTEARGTSNGFLLVCGVAGSASGLLLATQLEDLAGGLGPSIALCALAPLLAALLVVPRLPETRARTLDDVSPSGA